MNVWNTTTTYALAAITQHQDKLYQSLQATNTNHLPSEPASAWWALYADPITQVYNALWALLEAHAPLASMVELRNRINYTGTNRDPEKTEILTACLPEMRLTPVAGTPHLQRTSTGSSILKRFRVEVSSGDQRFDAGLFALEWEVYRALRDWFATLSALTWNGKSGYVKLARPTSIVTGVAERDLERGIKGWAAVWEMEVELWFTTNDL